MKINIFAIFICLLLLSQVLSTIVVADPELEIESIEGGKGVTVFIKNIGDENATNINWDINIKHGFILFTYKTIPKVSIHRIIKLKPGVSVEVNLIVIGFGLGIIFNMPIITAWATCNEGAYDEDSVYAALFFNRVFIL
jgi:hypothetical protein